MAIPGGITEPRVVTRLLGRRRQRYPLDSRFAAEE
jgi:hypothetical protein